MSNIKIALCGDLFISKRFPEKGVGGIWNELCEHECRFGNLETTIHRREGYPAAFPGGGYAMADPNCLIDLKNLGFNLFSTANNHSMDYSCNGLLATIKYMDECGLSYAGTGKNLADACHPAYYECRDGRVGLIAVTSSFHDSYMAGPQNEEMMGRPGVNPLRFNSVYELDDERFDVLEGILQDTGINNQVKYGEKLGYDTKLDNLRIGTSYYRFQRGRKCAKHTTPNEVDLKRTLDTIKDMRNYTDVIIVSVHSHQFDGDDLTNTPEFVQLFSKRCIDAGANVIVCHGPHVLRGIEVYNKGIIFYSLGNFIFQNELVSYLPEELYWRYRMTRQTATGPGALFEKRSKGGSTGLKQEPDVWRSMMVSMTFNEDKTDFKLIPVSISTKTGWPEISDDISILDKVKQMSANYNTCVEIDVCRKYAVVKY